jgi:hypothetical protein
MRSGVVSAVQNDQRLFPLPYCAGLRISVLRDEHRQHVRLVQGACPTRQIGEKAASTATFLLQRCEIVRHIDAHGSFRSISAPAALHMHASCGMIACDILREVGACAGA